MARAATTHYASAINIGEHFHTDVPLYIQVKELLKARVESGFYLPGERLPSEKELAREFSVSLITMRKALDLLAAMDLIHRRSGRGTFVQEVVPADRKVVIPLRLTGAFRDLINQGKEMETIPLEKAQGNFPIPWSVREFLRVQQGEVIWRFKRMRKLEGLTVSLVLNYVKDHLGRRIGLEDLKKCTMLELIADYLQEPLEGVSQTIESASACEEVASHLHVPIGTTLLRTDTFVTGPGVTPLQVAVSYFVGARYRFHVEFVR